MGERGVLQTVRRRGALECVYWGLCLEGNLLVCPCLIRKDPLHAKDRFVLLCLRLLKTLSADA